MTDKRNEKKFIIALSKLARKNDISKITIDDICREAKCHRTSFYNHFDTKDDLVKKTENEICSLFESKVLAAGDIKAMVYASIKIIDEYDGYFKAYFNDDRLNRKYHLSVIEEHNNQFFADNYAGKLTDEQVAYIKYGTNKILIDWINSDNRISSDELADKLMEIVSRIIGTDAECK